MQQQYYGLSGRKIKPNYVDAVNSGARLLPQRREVEDLADYRKKSLDAEGKRLANDVAFRRESLTASELDRKLAEDMFAEEMALESGYRREALTQQKADSDRANALLEKQIADEQTFAKNKLSSEEALAYKAMKDKEKADEKAQLIGYGQLVLSAYGGNKRDTKLKEAIAGGGDGGGEVGATAEGSKSGKGGWESLLSSFSGNKGDGSKAVISSSISDLDRGMYDAQANSEASPSSGFSTYGLGRSPYETGAYSSGQGSSLGSIWSGMKGGLSNWGDIATGGFAGGALGSALGGKYIKNNDTGRAIGGALGAGLMSYLSSGNPYTAAWSALFGGALGALF